MRSEGLYDRAAWISNSSSSSEQSEETTAHRLARERPRLLCRRRTIDEPRQLGAGQAPMYRCRCYAAKHRGSNAARNLDNLREGRAQPAYGPRLAENRDHLVDARAYCPASQGYADGLG